MHVRGAAWGVRVVSEGRLGILGLTRRSGAGGRPSGEVWQQAGMWLVGKAVCSGACGCAVCSLSGVWYAWHSSLDGCVVIQKACHADVHCCLWCVCVCAPERLRISVCDVSPLPSLACAALRWQLLAGWSGPLGVPPLTRYATFSCMVEQQRSLCSGGSPNHAPRPSEAIS